MIENDKTKEVKEEEDIEKFVDDAIKRNDLILVDILWIFFCSMLTSSKSAYENPYTGKKFNEFFIMACKRNLNKKYSLTQEKIKEKMFSFYNSLESFLSRGFNEVESKLRNILINKTSEILIRNIQNKIQNLSELEKKILSFILNYKPIWIGCKRTGSIDYFEIYYTHMKELQDIFNHLFHEKLKEKRIKIRSDESTSLWQKPHEDSFCEFGDILVKIGVGYWTFNISSKGRSIWINFIIPNFIYEAIREYKTILPIIENFEEKINKIEKEIKWGLNEIEDEERESKI